MLRYITLVIVLIMCICFGGHLSEAAETKMIHVIRERDYKKAISIQKGLIEHVEYCMKSGLLHQLAILYLKDQDQEHAFEAYLQSLDSMEVKNPAAIDAEDEKLYLQALAIYNDHSGPSPKAISEKIVYEFSQKLKDHPHAYFLSFLIALAHANLGDYEEFFEVFNRAYEIYPDHFLAYKTKAILHIKLMERKRSDADRQSERNTALTNLLLAIEREPGDSTLYKLVVTFSSLGEKQKNIRLCLNKIIDENIIIPRSDVLFYVQEAVNVKEIALAESYIDKARSWYKQSRIVDAAQEYLNAHK